MSSSRSLPAQQGHVAERLEAGAELGVWSGAPPWPRPAPCRGRSVISVTIRSASPRRMRAQHDARRRGRGSPRHGSAVGSVGSVAGGIGASASPTPGSAYGAGLRVRQRHRAVAGPRPGCAPVAAAFDVGGAATTHGAPEGDHGRQRPPPVTRTAVAPDDPGHGQDDESGQASHGGPGRRRRPSSAVTPP